MCLRRKMKIAHARKTVALTATGNFADGEKHDNAAEMAWGVQ